MGTKRVERPGGRKIIKYTPPEVPPKPSGAKQTENTAEAQSPKSSGCFRISKPVGDSDAENTTRAEQSGCTFGITKPVGSNDESPDVDPNHRYAVC